LIGSQQPDQIGQGRDRVFLRISASALPRSSRYICAGPIGPFGAAAPALHLIQATLKPKCLAPARRPRLRYIEENEKTRTHRVSQADRRPIRVSSA